MTESDQRAETWKPVPAMDGCTYSGYEASDKGGFRSVDRRQGNRQLRGKVLATRRHEDGYRLINIRCDSTDPDHDRVHTFAAHKVVLHTFAGPPGPGQEACHSPRGPAFNWWPEGVRWGTRPENDAERVAALRQAGRSGNGRALPAPKQVRLCILCSAPVTHGGRRCHECVVRIGRHAARLLRTGLSPDEVAVRLDYPSPSGVAALAVRYGRRPWPQRVMVTLRGILARRGR